MITQSTTDWFNNHHDEHIYSIQKTTPNTVVLTLSNNRTLTFCFIKNDDIINFQRTFESVLNFYNFFVKNDSPLWNFDPRTPQVSDTWIVIGHNL